MVPLVALADLSLIVDTAMQVGLVVLSRPDYAGGAGNHRPGCSVPIWGALQSAVCRYMAVILAAWDNEHREAWWLLIVGGVHLLGIHMHARDAARCMWLRGPGAQPLHGAITLELTLLHRLLITWHLLPGALSHVPKLG